jgi:hypothetical protein
MLPNPRYRLNQFVCVKSRENPDIRDFGLINAYGYIIEGERGVLYRVGDRWWHEDEIKFYFEGTDGSKKIVQSEGKKRRKRI